VESKAKDPVIPLSLFKNTTFNISTALGLLVGVGMFASIAFMPTYMQMVYGYSATVSGYLLVPMIIGIMIAVNLTGILVAKHGHYKKYPLIGISICTLSLYLFSTLAVGQSIVLVCFYIFLMGAGVGCFIQILILAVQNSVPFEEVGTATSANSFFREIGATMGIAIVGALFSTRLTSMLAERLPAEMPQASGNAQSLTPAILRVMPENLQDIFIHSYADALTPIFLYLVPVFIGGIILACFLPNIKLEQKIPELPTEEEIANEAEVAVS
tara:strand:+ start:157 stop:966 length:810 start_codon:yes stop_codon:yes gene_type:complete